MSKIGRRSKLVIRALELKIRFRALCVTSEVEVLQRVFSHAMADPEHYDLHKVVIPVMQKLHRSQGHPSVGEARYGQLLQYCLDNLTKTPVQIPSHWRQDIKLSCNCANCAALQQFLLDPQEQVRRFRVRKNRRQHLHQQIDRHGGDMSPVTERRSPPQTLVCTKNRASYERKQKQFEVETQLLAELRVLAAA